MAFAQTSLRNDINLKAYYKFDSGNLYADETGSFNLSAGGTPVAGTGKFTGALSSNGRTGYATISNDLGITSGAFSMGGWFKLDNVIASGTSPWVFFEKSEASAHVYMVLFYEWNGGTPRFRVYRDKGGGAGNIEPTHNVTLSAGVWYHILITYSGTTLKLYLNNAEVLSGTQSGTGSSGYGDLTSILTAVDLAGGAYKVDGSVDDFVVFNRELTSGEVSTIYSSPLDPTGGANIMFFGGGVTIG